MKKLTLLFTFLIFSITTYGQIAYDSYRNARFGYSLSYPSNLIPQGEADNGDGQVFKNDDATLTVFGTNLIMSKSLLNEFNATIRARGARNVTYKLFRKNYFVVTGKQNGRIFYQKVIRQPNDSYITFIFEYDESKRGFYDKATVRIVRSFR